MGSEMCIRDRPNIILPLAPVVTDNCDYTDAADFDGWGLDPVTIQSCPPLTDDISVDETMEVANNIEGTDTIDGSNGVLANPIPADNSPDDSSGSSDGVNAAAEDEDIAVDNEVAVSDTQEDSASTDLNLTDAITSQGGGSIWLPLLIFALALKRPTPAIRQLN